MYRPTMLLLIIWVGTSTWQNVNTLAAQEQIEAPANSLPSPKPPEIPQAEAPDDIEVLNRGPLHEAFAAPGSNDLVQTPVIAKQPPEPLDELPPEQRPEGKNVVWIPGYWAFDDEMDDYIWVSGIWRDVPLDRRWVPGYWVDVDGGHRWVPGMWAGEKAEEFEYLPPPPPSQDRGPSSPAPSENHFYVPGNWMYQDSTYRWRPGYWEAYRSDSVWVPNRYVWTPAGCVFVSGYWDYPLEDRGLIYAPVCFPHHIYRPYRPAVVVNFWQSLLVHLFVRPSCGVYVFGNYYHHRHHDHGIVPWHHYAHTRVGFDPFYHHLNWTYGNAFHYRNVGWHTYYSANPQFQPRGTLREQLRFEKQHPGHEGTRHGRLTLDMHELQRDHGKNLHLTSLANHEMDFHKSHAEKVRELSRLRTKLEYDSRSDRAKSKLDNPAADSKSPRNSGPQHDPKGDKRPGDKRPGDKRPGDKRPGDKSGDKSASRQQVTTLKIPVPGGGIIPTQPGTGQANAGQARKSSPEVGKSKESGKRSRKLPELNVAIPALPASVAEQVQSIQRQAKPRLGTSPSGDLNLGGKPGSSGSSTGNPLASGSLSSGSDPTLGDGSTGKGKPGRQPLSGGRSPSIGARRSGVEPSKGNTDKPPSESPATISRPADTAKLPNDIKLPGGTTTLPAPAVTSTLPKPLRDGKSNSSGLNSSPLGKSDRLRSQGGLLASDAPMDASQNSPAAKKPLSPNSEKSSTSIPLNTGNSAGSDRNRIKESRGIDGQGTGKIPSTRSSDIRNLDGRGTEGRVSEGGGIGRRNATASDNIGSGSSGRSIQGRTVKTGRSAEIGR